MTYTSTPRVLSRCALVLLLILGIAFSAGDADAGKYRKTAFSRSAPIYTKPPAPRKSSNANGYTKPAQRSASPFSGTSASDRNTATALKKKQAASSYAAHQAERDRFTAKSTPLSRTVYTANPIFTKARKKRAFDYQTHYRRRDDYYRHRGWTAPRYAYRTRPSFGMWDAMVWWMVLSNLTSRNSYAMAYHHADDPGYREWRQEADRLAREDADLKRQLSELDSRVASMKGTPVQDDYLPEGMTPEVALAADVMADTAADRPAFTLAAAAPDVHAARFGALVTDAAPSVDVRVRATTGPMETLRLLASGEVDAAIVPADALALFQRTSPQTPLTASEQVALYPEVVQIIAHTDSRITRVEDLAADNETLLFIGPKGSGTALTWEGICRQDPSYRRVKTRHASDEAALRRVLNDPRAVMMTVAGLHSPTLNRAEHEAQIRKNLRLVPVDDWDLNNAKDSRGQRIYQFVTIPASTYPGLQRGLILGKDVESISMTALLVVRTDWARENGPDAMDDLSNAIMESAPVIRRETQGLTP